MYVAEDKCDISIVFPVSAITLFPAISYTSISYSLSLFNANRDDVGFGYSVGVVCLGTLDAKFCPPKSNSTKVYTEDAQVLSFTSNSVPDGNTE